MPKVTTKTIIELNESEATALKNLLGSMTDDDFRTFGIIDEDRQTMSNMYDSILDFDDD